MIMCLAHEGILVISHSQGLFCKHLLLRDCIYKIENKKNLNSFFLFLSNLNPPP
ncbi:hypothetical protein Hanom_Chr12g01100771 [Helianthus anomalus]